MKKNFLILFGLLTVALAQVNCSMQDLVSFKGANNSFRKEQQQIYCDCGCGRKVVNNDEIPPDEDYGI